MHAATGQSADEAARTTITGALPTPAATRARFLRGIDSDIGAFVLPALNSDDAAERAAFAGLVLSRLAAEADVTPRALALMKGGFEAQLVRCIVAIRGLGDEVEADRIAREADALDVAAVAGSERVFGLRGLLADCVRRLSRVESEAPGCDIARDELNAIGALERRWRAVQDLAEEPAPEKPTAGPSIYDRVTPESVTAYLRGAFPHSPEASATDVRVLAGGRSKKTTFLSITGSDVLPASVVMRQDTGLPHIGTRLAEERPVIDALAGHGLPIARIFHFEPDWTALGGPFLLMERLAGRQSGSFSAFAETDAGFIADVARALARLHRIDPRGAGLPDPDVSSSPAERFRKLVARYWGQWRDHAIEPSPLVDYAFDWVLGQLHLPLRCAAVVHGDYRPHNFLHDGAALTGIVDWEFAHIGDPAEDLAYIRPTVTPWMEWPQFMAHYQGAGGAPCDDEVLRFYDVWGTLRLAAMGAGAARSFIDGSSDDFPQGAGGYFVLPMFERQLAQLLG